MKYLYSCLAVSCMALSLWFSFKIASPVIYKQLWEPMVIQTMMDQLDQVEE